MSSKDTQFKPGERRSIATEFKPGQHWRKPQAFRDAAWLTREYVELQRSTGDIAKQFGVGDSAIQFWLKKHGITRRNVAQARAIKHWGVSGPLNPMFGKRGAEAPSWRGGHTPERQAFHGSAEWKEASLAVWRRDNGTCQRCEAVANHRPELKFDVHHIVGFEVTALRAAIDNLVLLCRPCHRWVHSKANVGMNWIGIDLDLRNEALQRERIGTQAAFTLEAA